MEAAGFEPPPVLIRGRHWAGCLTSRSLILPIWENGEDASRVELLWGEIMILAIIMDNSSGRETTSRRLPQIAALNPYVDL